MGYAGKAARFFMPEALVPPALVASYDQSAEGTRGVWDLDEDHLHVEPEFLDDEEIETDAKGFATSKAAVEAALASLGRSTMKLLPHLAAVDPCVASLAKRVIGAIGEQRQQGMASEEGGAAPLSQDFGGGSMRQEPEPRGLREEQPPREQHDDPPELIGDDMDGEDAWDDACGGASDVGGGASATAVAAAVGVRQVTMREGKEIKLSKCQPRVGVRYRHHSSGAVFMVCPCGYLFPPMELPDSESTRSVLYYVLKIFEGFSCRGKRGNLEFVLVFDDMCHLFRSVFMTGRV